MPKGRMTALDVRAMVSDVSPLVKRLRVANIYDISSKVYVLKLSEGDTKRHLVCEAGARFHLSEWKRDKQSIPSVFTMRLRKFLRTKRLTSFTQLGADRVIDMQFGLGENAMHLIIEFYARGNVVLTDHEYIVRSTWRPFKGDEALAVKVSQKYPIKEYQKESKFIATGLESVVQKDNSLIMPFLRSCLQSEIDRMKNDPKALRKKSSGVSVAFLVGRLMPVAHQKLVEQIIQESSLDNDVCEDTLEATLPSIYQVIHKLLSIWKTVSLSEMLGGGEEEVTVKGYLYKGQVNEDYSPIPIRAKDGWTMQQFDSFHQCVDQFYSSLEILKTEKVQSERVNELESRITKIRRDQTDRVSKLEKERDAAELQASSVERNLDFVSKALMMIKRAVETGSDWKLIEKMVKEQRKLGHPIATYIQKMDLKNRKFILLLSETAGWMDEEGSDDGELIPVSLNVDLTAFANVESLHSEKKAANTKFLKTQEAATRVIAAAEQAADKERQRKAVEVETRPPIQRLRKVFWFERFHWFISSDNYLVLAGHDATQNEILYRKYLRRNDIYVHAEVHGAATCIIRNVSGASVPQRTIDEAGQMSVCRSNAWKTKVLVQAYWVHAHQVSKTPQPGEYVSTGGFIIRGKRNPIIVKKLEMGIGLMFHLGDDESVQRHLRDNDLDKSILEEPLKPTDSEPAKPTNSERVDASEGSDLDESEKSDLESESDMDESDRSDVDESDKTDVEESEKHVDDSEQSVKRAEVLSAPRRPSLRKGSKTCELQRAVQFGAIHVMPTPTIQPRVDFDDLPPEVIVVHSERSILSDDDDHAMLSGRTKCEDVETDHEDDATSLSVPSSRRSFDIRRADSADELSPPADYRGKAGPRELLAHQTPETMTVESEDEDLALPECILEPFVSRGKSSPLLTGSSLRRSRVVDGGPLPRGFLEDEVPLPRTLLQLGARLSDPSPSEDEEEQSLDTSPSKKTGISRAARRRMKKGAKPTETIQPKSNKEKAQKPVAQLSKAKLKKLKKIKAKYEEQSEDEREIALKIIGAQRLKEEIVEPVKKENETPWNPPVEHIAKPDRNLLEENSEDEEDEEWKQKRQEQLIELTGRPLEKDTILFALPVCAPFSAIQSYTYKGRLTPGGGKKGHAVNLVHRAFVEMSPPNSVQRQLVKAITADELSAVLVASPVVNIQGGDKIQKQERRDRKAFSRAVSKAAKVD